MYIEDRSSLSSQPKPISTGYLKNGYEGYAEAYKLASEDNLVEVLAETRVDGARVVSVKVDDPYVPVRGTERLVYNGIQSRIMAIESALQSGVPDLVDTGLREGRELLDENPTIAQWKKYMTTAMALYPLQRPDAQTLLDGTEINEAARELFLYGQDSIGIRSRGAIFGKLLSEGDGQIHTIASLACGAAVPECDAIKNMIHKPRSVFVDWNEEALQHAEEIAQEAGLGKDQYQPVRIDLIKDFMYARTTHEALPEEGFEMVDALGITEYFNDSRVQTFLLKAYSLVKPGGSLVFGNMLDTHPTIQFNQQVVGWPDITPRSVDRLIKIASQITSPDKVTVYLPEDGVYAVVEIAKSLPTLERSVGSMALARS